MRHENKQHILRYLQSKFNFQLVSGSIHCGQAGRQTKTDKQKTL